MYIYYKSKSHPPGSIINSRLISPENISKLFDSDYRGFSLPSGKRFPINLFAWDSSPRFSGKFKVHPVFGRVFVPNAILATNGKVYYFVALIAGKVGIRRWPSFVAKKNFKLDHVNVTDNEVKMLEQCFSRLLAEVLPDEPIEHRFKKVKGTPLRYESLFEFVNMVLEKPSLAKALAMELSEAAENPVTYFSNNQRALSKLDIDEPDTKLYRTILIERLEHHRKLAYLDWRSRADEVASALKALAGKHKKTIIDPKGTYRDTYSMLKTAGKALRDLGLTGFSIATDADAYAIIVVNVSHTKRLRSLAKACKLKIQAL